MTAATLADDFSNRSVFFARLATSMTAVQDGKPLRDALTAIAAQVELNLWLDRKVDPTVPVTAGSVGPTVSAAIEQIAERHDCAVMPVADVILVGRTDWVEATAASLLSLQFDSQPDVVADIQWQPLTTPSEAISIVTGQSTEVTPPLPHDLWPAINWKKMDRRIAAALVFAQFDQRPKSTASMGKLSTEPALRDGVFTRRYSTGAESKLIRSAMQKRDPRSRFRVSGDVLVATGNIAAHRAAGQAILQQRANAAAEAIAKNSDPDQDTRRFIIKPKQTTAQNALVQFARSAGRTCVIRPDAAEACRKVITVKADENTLKEIIDSVAKTAGVVATWEADEIIITSK